MIVTADKNNRCSNFYPLLFAGITAFLKSSFLVYRLKGTFDISLFFQLLNNDLSILGCIGFFCCIHSITSFPKLLVSSVTIVAALFSLWYILDTYFIYLLNTRLPLSDSIRSFLDNDNPSEITLCLLSIAAYLSFVTFGKNFSFAPQKPALTVALTFLLIWVPRQDPLGDLNRFATTLVRRQEQRSFIGRAQPQYNEAMLLAHQAALPLHGNISTTQRPLKNIIMIIIESWSSIDSEASGGEKTLLPLVEAYATQHGRVYTNFYANFISTEGGLVSLLGGIPPLEYPESRWTFEKSFSIQDSITKNYAKAGYTTAAITTGPLAFLEKGTLLSSLGFKIILGLENSPLFSSAPKFAFGAPPDEYLYKAGISLMNKLRTTAMPWFLVLETITTHLPYINPSGKDHSESAVWHYTDTHTYNFIKHLEEEHFFDDGILIITSDHHKRELVSTQEKRLLGNAAEYKIPLFILGAGVTAQSKDSRLLQQSDLLSKLPQIINTQEDMITPLVTGSTYTVKPLFYGTNPVNEKIVHRNGSVYTWQRSGRSFSWISQTPPLDIAQEIESYLHRRLSRYQFCSTTGKC